MNLKNYILEYVSSGRGSARKSTLDIDSTVEDITSFIESFGFTKVNRLTGGTPKKPQYVVERARITDGYIVGFKFVGTDNRIYYGEFRTGNFPLYSRLLDITNFSSTTPVVANPNPKDAKENIDQITDFLKNNI